MSDEEDGAKNDFDQDHESLQRAIVKPARRSRKNRTDSLKENCHTVEATPHDLRQQRDEVRTVNNR